MQHQIKNFKLKTCKIVWNNKQETNEKMPKEIKELKKGMININAQLQQRREKIIEKVKETDNLKEEIKIMNKEQIQQKQKTNSERENK